MAIPIVLAVAAQVATRVATSPSTWRLIGTAALVIVGTPFVLKSFFTQAVDTVSTLWWVVALFFVLGLVKITVPIFIQEREETKREISRQGRKHDKS